MVAFDDYDGPGFTMPSGETLRREGKLVVPILRVRQDFMVGTNSCSRAQFPLLVSYAITVHKSQGITLYKVFCNIYAPEFAAGLSYVAVSRVKTLGGLMFENPFRPQQGLPRVVVKCYKVEASGPRCQAAAGAGRCQR